MVAPAKIAVGLLAAGIALIAPAISPGIAGDRFHDGYRHADRGFPAVDTRLPTRVPGIGTFAGGFAAVRDPGNGVYFHIEGTKRQQMAEATLLAPVAKIITVSSDGSGSGCSWEAGVCVIRP
ncbi:MAG: hypothetical protein QHC90_17470 [Shinella sp.]|nr:hypothetical protein [Shinella sp.]